jgi:hypothetical protein
MSVQATSTTTPFDDAMGRAWNGLTANEQSEFLKMRTIDDVYAETDRIQREQAKKASLRNLKRLEPYLLRLKEYSGVIEQFVQVKPEMLALIWVCYTERRMLGDMKC